MAAIEEQLVYEIGHRERQQRRVSTAGGARAATAHGAYTEAQRLTAVVQRAQRMLAAGGSEVPVDHLRAACKTALEAPDA
ncbi:MAG TPA: hypothetical protein PK948_04970 [Gemmatimonadales bacterium]|nr:hypothetical protein [Gemmatimonadales bacterium]